MAFVASPVRRAASSRSVVANASTKKIAAPVKKAVKQAKKAPAQVQEQTLSLRGLLGQINFVPGNEEPDLLQLAVLFGAVLASLGYIFIIAQ